MTERATPSKPSRSQTPRTGKVASRKVADLVASRLRMQIARGELQEGDWLPTEAELTEQFGVSRPTLREAFRLLEGDGLVQIRRGPPGGARVQLPGPEQAARLFGLILTLSGTTLRDVYEARMVLEPPAVAQLARSSTLESNDELSELISAARDVIHDDESFAAATTAFHLHIVRLSGNHTLAAVSGMLSEITTRHVALGYRETRRRSAEEIGAHNEHALRSYEKLLSLIREQRPDEAESFWRKHMAAVLDLLDDENDATGAVIDVLE